MEAKDDKMAKKVNSVKWWNGYFQNEWEANHGKEQTAFFMQLIIHALPENIKDFINRPSTTILDWGCALGQGVDLLAKKFPNAKVTGLDISDVAIEKAKALYPDYKFTTESLENINERYTVIFCSNCIEHFEKTEKLINEHLKFTEDLYVILVPYKEENRIESHLVSFDNDSFPTDIGDFCKIYSKIIDIIDTKFWQGSQLLVVYARRTLNIVNEYLGYNGKITLSSLDVNQNIDSQSPQLWDKVAEAYTEEADSAEIELGREIENLLTDIGVKQGASLLEVGCGSGHLSGYLASKGFKTTSMDFSKVALAKAKSYYEKHNLTGNFILCDMRELSMEKVEPHDVVWNSGVLEHFDSWQVIDTLKRMGKVTRKFVIVLVPNARSFPYLLFRRHAMENNEWVWGRELLRESLRCLAEAAGLEVVEEKYLGHHYSQYHLNYVKSEFGREYMDMCQQNLIPDNQGYLITLVARPRPDQKIVGYEELINKILKEESVVANKTYHFDLSAISNRLQSLQKREEELATTIQAKNAEIERLVKDIGSLQNINLNHQKREEELTTSLQAKDAHISELDAEIERMVKDIGSLQNINLNHQKREEELTTSLQAKDAHIREIEDSMIWQFLMKYQKFVEALLPLGTSRRRYYDAWLLWMRNIFNRTKNFQRENKVGITQDAYDRTKNVDIICFPIINWDFRYQRPQQLLSRFAKNGYRVFYLTVDLKPLNRKYIAREIQKNILELKPSISTKFNVYGDTLSKEQIDSLISATDQVKKDFKINRALCFAAFPTWGPVVSKLRDTYDWKIIYDCLDEHSGFSNVDNSIVHEEEMLIKKSDLVIVTSSHLYKKVKKYRNDALLIPNAGDFEHFSELPKNDLLKNIKKPIIGYYGAIAEWFDNELLEFLANKRKDWNFVLIGHTFGSNISKLQKFHNVHFLGEKPYSELPKYLYWFDVCIIPFKLTPLIEATHPVKFYEYLSSGKPVVSAKLPELLPYNDLCYLADSKEDFLNKIEIGLKEDNLETKRKRIEFAKSNTWDDRYERLASHAKEIFKEEDN
jgi:2-polyprenyl-3-methyl-5-hydroxy-6-metoxy-1,4-benzoquinol methylase